MNKFLAVAVLASGLALASPANAAPRHALAKVGAAAVAVVKVAPQTAAKSLKVTVGSIVFAAESVNDVVLVGLTALDKVAAVELKHNPFHYAAVVDGKIDAGLEYAEEYFFGLSGT